MLRLARRPLAAAASASLSTLRPGGRGFCSTACRQADASVFSDEPARPAVRTSIPGPRSQEAISDLDSVFDTRSLNMLVDYDRSRGN